ncbi:hypothetical protein Sm713_50070 [Streptomyces sp. TS71-3]|nr:hypothetical protein Sm713_50070 [Streptomyces sp. TS71-3]
MLEGELRLQVDGESHLAGAGAAALLPRGLPHAFVVTSPQARYLTLHTPAGFERFALADGTPASSGDITPPGEPPPTRKRSRRRPDPAASTPWGRPSPPDDGTTVAPSVSAAA